VVTIGRSPLKRPFTSQSGRWPEVKWAPPLWSGALAAFLTTSATMIAFINSVVAGTGVTMLANRLLGGGQIALSVALGAVASTVLMAIFSRLSALAVPLRRSRREAASGQE